MPGLNVAFGAEWKSAARRSAMAGVTVAFFWPGWSSSVRKTA